MSIFISALGMSLRSLRYTKLFLFCFQQAFSDFITHNSDEVSVEERHGLNLEHCAFSLLIDVVSYHEQLVSEIPLILMLF